jgi:hypothetical protein
MLATQKRASHRSLQNQTIGIKAWVRTTEYIPIQQTPGIRRTITFAGGAFRKSTLEPNPKGHDQVDLCPSTRGTLGPPLFTRLAALTLPVSPTGSPEKNKAARSTDDGLVEAMVLAPMIGAKRVQIWPRLPPLLNRRRRRWSPRSTHSSRTTGEVHQATATGAMPPGVLSMRPTASHEAPLEDLSIPSSFDGRGAATTTGVRISGGVKGGR